MNRLTLLFFVVALQSQPPAEPTLAAAIARMQANDPAGAARILEDVTTREPANGRAWRNLGSAYQSTKEFDKAIAAYQRALDAEPAVPTPMYQLGLVYALKQDADRAFEWLGRARATRRIDMMQATVAPELEPLKTDPRFAAVLPTRADFDSPFVEDVRILREWDGEAANDQFGWIARGIGDVDGDGHPDLIVGAWQYAGAAISGGRAYLYSGKDGRVMKTYTCRTPGDTFGFDAVSLGDVDGDGTADFLITSGWSGVGGFHSGRVFIVSSGVPR